MKQRVKDAYQKLRATNILSNFFNLSGIQFANILLLLLMIPLITRRVGFYQFGVIMFASRFAQLAGSVINYGTGQSGVRDVVFNLKDTKKLSAVFYNTLCIRLVIFGLFLASLYAMQWLPVQWLPLSYYTFILIAIPIALAEVFNPMCFFIGAERLRVFNLINLVFNVVCFLALIAFIKSPKDAAWVNFIIGSGNVVTYLVLLIYFGRSFKLLFIPPGKEELLKTGKDNFYLTINNISVNLQQSIIIFMLPRWGYEVLLGPYTLCDRIIGQCRNLLVTLSNALYPNAARSYQLGAGAWNIYRHKTKYLIAAVFFAGSLLIFILAGFIVHIFSKEHTAMAVNTTAVLFLRIMAFVPAISALNVLNVLDQLLKNNTVYIFRIAVILFVIAFVTALVSLNVGNYFLIGSFTLIVETCAWLMYEYAIKKTVNHG